MNNALKRIFVLQNYLFNTNPSQKNSPNNVVRAVCIDLGRLIWLYSVETGHCRATVALSLPVKKCYIYTNI